MQSTTTILGIDYGQARIGLALGNTETKLATPYKTIKASTSVLEELQRLCQAEGVEKLVLGLPRGLDGQETAQTAITRQFATSLATLGLPIELRDEAGTTALAEQQSGKKPPAAGLDAVAAAIILQDYFDEAQ